MRPTQDTRAVSWGDESGAKPQRDEGRGKAFAESEAGLWGPFEDPEPEAGGAWRPPCA